MPLRGSSKEEVHRRGTTDHQVSTDLLKVRDRQFLKNFMLILYCVQAIGCLRRDPGVPQEDSPMVSCSKIHKNYLN